MTRILLALPLLMLAACGDEMTYPGEIERETQAAQQAVATPVAQIALVASNTINGGKFKVLGDVSSTVGKATAFHANPTAEMAQQKLRIEAADLGADAVINTKIGEIKVCALSWGCRVSTGTAVKFLN